jgi:bifunctional DNase/RNase
MKRKVLLLASLLSGFCVHAAAQRHEDAVEVQIDEMQATPAGISLTLRAADSRDLHLLIGLSEGQSIVRALRHETSERPLGHDLFKSFLDRNGWKVQKVLIRELKDGAFLSDLTIEKADHETQVYDARPSDAMAMGIRYGAKIYVNPQVFEQEKKTLEGDPGSQQDEDQQKPSDESQQIKL